MFLEPWLAATSYRTRLFPPPSLPPRSLPPLATTDCHHAYTHRAGAVTVLLDSEGRYSTPEGAAQLQVCAMCVCVGVCVWSERQAGRRTSCFREPAHHTATTAFAAVFCCHLCFPPSLSHFLTCTIDDTHTHTGRVSSECDGSLTQCLP